VAPTELYNFLVVIDVPVCRRGTQLVAALCERDFRKSRTVRSAGGLRQDREAPLVSHVVETRPRTRPHVVTTWRLSRSNPGAYRWRFMLAGELQMLEWWDCGSDFLIDTEPLGRRADERWGGILNLPNEFSILDNPDAPI
jgi:hypothetical protein